MASPDANAQNVIEDMRKEYNLSPERVRHITWLLNDGLLNPTDIRTMLARRAAGSLSLSLIGMGQIMPNGRLSAR